MDPQGKSALKSLCQPNSHSWLLMAEVICHRRVLLDAAEMLNLARYPSEKCGSCHCAQQRQSSYFLLGFWASELTMQPALYPAQGQSPTGPSIGEWSVDLWYSSKKSWLMDKMAVSTMLYIGIVGRICQRPVRYNSQAVHDWALRTADRVVDLIGVCPCDMMMKKSDSLLRSCLWSQPSPSSWWSARKRTKTRCA